MRGYLTLPAADAGRVSGVLVLPEAVGLNDNIRAHADRLGAAGSVVFAPDHS